MTRLPTSYFGQLIMTLRFSEHGPVFPSKLVDALMAGEVVFLCGAGVSAPQLHGFQKLVDLTFERLNVEMSTSEANAYNGGRFEEVLGSLERRLAEAGRMVRAVSDLLSVPDEPELDHHATLLRLSRDLENRILIVTTNFDTLLERASSAVAPDPVPAKISFAGQSLPAPSSAEFSGVRRQRLWPRFGVADNGGIGSRRSDVRNEDETQSLQPKIGCQAHQEARRGGGEGYSPGHAPTFFGRG